MHGNSRPWFWNLPASILCVLCVPWFIFFVQDQCSSVSIIVHQWFDSSDALAANKCINGSIDPPEKADHIPKGD